MSSSRSTGLRRLSACFHQAVEPIFLLDSEGKWAYVNPAWETLTGWSADSILGREPSTCEAGHGKFTSLNAFAPTAETFKGVPTRGRLPIPADDGKSAPQVTFHPLQDGLGAVLGILGTVRSGLTTFIEESSYGLDSRAALAEAKQAIRLRLGSSQLIGHGARHGRLLEQIATARLTTTPVLVVGEPGTGKNLVANLIHEGRADRSAPRYVLDLAAFPSQEIDQWLFDAERLAIGAPTIVLKESSLFPRDLQAKLVEEIRKPGGPRVLLTCSVEPDLALQDGRWREDFYFAMTALVIRLAPLRERIDEIPLLAQHFLEDANRRNPQHFADLTLDAVEALTAYDWPGNVRELATVVNSSHNLSKDREIFSTDLPPQIRGEYASAIVPQALPVSSTPLDEWLINVERRLIENALKNARNNKSRAAELLEISRPRLHRRIKELGLEGPKDSQDLS